jgi:hypothetical protein
MDCRWAALEESEMWYGVALYSPALKIYTAA